MPRPVKLHSVDVTEAKGFLSMHWLASVPPAIISDAMHTGASTGPHQGSGNRNRMSQSKRDTGQPQMALRNT
jgi:hypothetical protein